MQTFLKVTLPLTTPGIVSGITMVFIPALTTFVISDLLGGSKILLIGNVIEQEFKQTNNWNAGSALSTVLMIFIILSMVLMNKYDKDRGGNGILRKKLEKFTWHSFFILLYAPIVPAVALLMIQNACQMGRLSTCTGTAHCLPIQRSMNALHTTQ